MSATITITDYVSPGSVRQAQGTGNLGVYATGGVSVTANKFGLGTIDRVVIDPAGGYTFRYNATTAKVQAFCGDGGLAAHSHDLTVIGSQVGATTNATAVYTDTLGKEVATNRTIAGAAVATKGGVGSYSSNGGVEVDTSTNLTTVIFNWRAFGR